MDDFGLIAPKVYEGRRQESPAGSQEPEVLRVLHSIVLITFGIHCNQTLKAVEWRVE